MHMRASQQEQTGGAGQHEVAGLFERIGWGPALNHVHDLGTDIFLQVRDARRVDLGLVVGAQVKAGPSYFAEEERDADGALVGWWFRDPDRRHIDAWLKHSVPHLIVLYDLDDRKAYWAHVNDEAVVSTGSGAKLLVPSARLVDSAHLDALLDVAGAGQPGSAWEGSIWTAGASILERDRLRHALIVPRLVAPHPNAGVAEPLGAEQAVALVMQARIQNLERFAEKHAQVPRLQDASGNDDWMWRFAGAMWKRTVEANAGPLLATIADAPSPATHAAATVAAASVHIEDGRIEAALELLESALERDDQAAVDYAWLLVQRARARAEIGQLAQAQDDALLAQGVRRGAGNDATAGAIAASAAILLFNTSTWGHHDVKAMVTSADSAASWWRVQTTSRALWAIAERSFETWTRHESVTFGAEDVAHNQLIVSSLMASHTGDQSGWRQLTAAGAQNELEQFDRFAEPHAVASALGRLRLAGDQQALQKAVRRLVADGPAEAVAIAADSVELANSTRTTALANLILLEAGGDVLNPAVASRAVAWILTSMDDHTAFASRTTPSFRVVHQLPMVLAAVVGAADTSAQRATADYVLNLPAIEQQLDAQAWSSVATALPAGTWTADDLAAVVDAAARHEFVLRLGLLGVAAVGGNQSARDTLIEEARGGSVEAVGALGDVRELPHEVAGALIASLVEATSRLIEEAHSGKHGFGGHDLGFDLVLLNVWHPNEAQWEPLVQLLDDEAVIAENKSQALGALANASDRVPADIQKRLAPIADRLSRAGASSVGFFGDPREVQRAAALLAASMGALDAATAGETVSKLLAGNARDRLRGLAIAARVGTADQLGMLLVLAGDGFPSVRAAAASQIAKQLGKDASDGFALATLRICAADPGVVVPLSIASALADAETLETRAVREALCDHRSARVRAAARGLDV